MCAFYDPSSKACGRELFASRAQPQPLIPLVERHAPIRRLSAGLVAAALGGGLLGAVIVIVIAAAMLAP